MEQLIERVDEVSRRLDALEAPQETAGATTNESPGLE